MITNHLTKRLLKRNTWSNHYRIIIGMGTIMLLILLLCYLVRYLGLASENLSYYRITRLALISLIVVILALVYIRQWGRHFFTKWVVITTCFFLVVMGNITASQAPESHVLFYLLILLSMFYMDYLLVLYCTVISIAADLTLCWFYPSLKLPGSFGGAVVMRYFTYVWAGILATWGTVVARKLIQRIAELISEKMSLQEDIRRKQKREKLRSDFVAGVSHEIRTPVSLIKGYAEALRDDVERPEEKQHYLEVLINESDKIDRLVADMLVLTRMESGTFALDWQEFDLDELITDVVRKVSELSRDKIIKLEYQVPENTWVWGDPFRIEQVMQNMLSNAWRHTQSGGLVHIKVVPGDDIIQIEISNQGEKIPPDQLGRVWDAFYRLDKSRSRKSGGNGLGLAIVRTILALHKSQYGVENTEDGVKFFFTLEPALE